MKYQKRENQIFFWEGNFFFFVFNQKFGVGVEFLELGSGGMFESYIK